MKKIIIGFLLILFVSKSGFSKEGMWPPFLFSQIKKDLKNAGLKLNINELYSEENSSLKDAIVIFGGGCTGEVISKNGLVLTNHHCGYGTVQRLSSIQNNMLTNGFFAKNIQEEIPCPGLTVTFVKSYKDVTAKVLEGTENKNLSASDKQKIIEENTKKILKTIEDDKNFDYIVSNFYQGNVFYLIKREVYKDIRLVAFPPNGIGKFGGDTDNWVWPRHTGDFSVFRIYANKNNEAAEYNKDNIAYVPKRYLKINTEAKENDFTMVYGFPGRTQEYISSAELNNIIESVDPTRVSLREAKLNIWNEAMSSHEEDFVKYASKQAGVANYWKKWKGEMIGLRTNDGLGKKIIKENLMKAWAAALPSDNINHSRIFVLDSLKNIFSTNDDFIKSYNYYLESLNSLELLEVTSKIAALKNLKPNVNLDSMVDNIKNSLIGFYKNYNDKIDQKVSIRLFDLYQKNIAQNYQPTFMQNSSSMPDLLHYVFANSCFSTERSILHSLDEYKTSKDFGVFEKDTLYALSTQIKELYNNKFKNQIANFNDQKNNWNADLMNCYFDFNQGKSLYPDANFTLRLTYGKIQGCKPADGMEYLYYTTVDGITQKNNPAVEEFEAPQKLLHLINQKDYGQYEQNGTVPLAFLASNHTTGGNSGSPVLNKRGELIGTNFDRIWEGTMSDLYFDPNICRNISVNIRYTLFILDKFGGATWLLNEMDIVK